MGVIGILLKNWSLVAIGILVVALLGSMTYISLLKSQKEVLEGEKGVLRSGLSIADASIKSLQSAINEQNLAIESFKKDAEERAKKAQSLISAAEARAKLNEKKAADLLKRTVPAGKSVCDAADDLINEAIRDAK